MLHILKALVLTILLVVPARADQPLTVFAAASMREAMEEIGTTFAEESGTDVLFSFAGTGTLARQIEAGAPADVFVSADAEWMDYVLERQAVLTGSVREIASNRLVLLAPAGSARLQPGASDLPERLEDERLAIADPETVPAGRYGKAALQALGLWDTVSSQLAPMDNVRVVLAAVARGDVPFGLVYRTDAVVASDALVVYEFPDDGHPRIRYLAAQTANGSHVDADRFLQFLKGPVAQEILHSSGFLTDKEG
ncbi:molybdate ABC transporter substrate-binding protein [uncultured Roseibium sp.]|uniref:molybdate ABC transporter substrate-binding protein n=1 Tax=uncultured Roseibium sp. TaxID=1936171 RepID=UPI002623924D|nr:molybdate ABC transporter substrate-binding protein [uncultured Roseibium sp.]